MRCRALFLLGTLIAGAALAAGQATLSQPGNLSALRTRAERSNFEETSTAADVQEYVSALAASPLVHVTSFGRTEEGRDLRLLVVSSPKISTPEEARRSGRPIILIQANIHAGEVEGKEAALILARRLVDGDLASLARRLVILIAPNYNADGNERTSPMNRSEQNGPVAGVGTRENAKGLDLNRDHMKLESAEARGLVGLLNAWDPHLVLDLHTTDGSYHGYHLTYSPILSPNADSRLIAFERDTMLPDVRTATLDKHQFQTYYYGNFSPEGNAARESARVDPANPGDVTWRTFDHRPRFGNNYVGLRNRFAILSEAFSYLDFKGRVDVTLAFTEEILRFVDANASRVRSMTAQADSDAADRRLPPSFGVAFDFRASPQPVEILVSDVTRLRNPRSGRDMLQRTNSAVPVKMKEYGDFQAIASRPMPNGWLIPRDAVASGRLNAAIDRLRWHGVRIDEVTRPITARVEQFEIAGITRPDRAFQGHRETKLTGRLVASQLAVEPGSLFVSARQPLARLAFYLLEPESDDGLVDWNLLDDALTIGQLYPVARSVGGTIAASSLKPF